MAATTRRSTGRQLAVEAVAITVAVAVGVAFSGVIIGMEAGAAKTNATQAKSAAESGDLAAMVASVEALQSNLTALSAFTKSPSWFITQRIPGIGDPVRAAATLTTGVNAVAQAAQGFVSIAKELERSSTTDAQLVPESVLTELPTAASQLASALSALSDDIQGLRVTAAYGPFQGPATDALEAAQRLLPDLTRLVEALPAVTRLLGSESRQSWFVALQNGAESRGTGGLLGSYAIVEVDRGRASTTTLGANDQLTAKADPQLLPEDSRALWGPQRLAEVYGVNLSGNFPYAGELISSMWRNQTGELPDAVLALDQRSTALLLDAVGGVTVDGVTVTGANALRILTIDVYTKYPHPAAKDKFVTDLMGKLVSKISSGQTSPITLARAFADAVLERSVFIWAADEGIQASLASTPVGGEIPDQPGPITMAVINNNAGNKMDAFLRTSIGVKAGECVPGGRRSSMTVELSNNPPQDLPSYVDQRTDRRNLFGLDGAGDGSNRVRVAIYLPQGAYLSSSTPSTLYTGSERGHPVAMFGVELRKGERKSVIVEYTEFGEPATLNEAPEVIAQPMLNAQQIDVTRGPIC